MDPVAIARSLQPLIREHADAGERDRRLAEPVVRAMDRAGLFRVGSPAGCGGMEADPATIIEVIEAVSEADGATGWTLMVGVEVGLIVAAMDPRAAGSLLRDGPDLIMCGALYPTGRARPVEGGFVVNGRWSYASGCTVADWFCGGCILIGDDGEPDRRPKVRQVIVPRAEYLIDETWDAAGLTATGSHDVIVSDVFVPDERVTDIYGTGMRVDGDLFRFPLPSRLASSKVGVATGIARSVLTTFRSLAAEKTPLLSSVPLRERAQAQLAIAEAEARLRGSRAFVFETVATLWDAIRAGREATRDERAMLRLACAHCCREAVAAVDLVAAQAGMTASTGPRAFTRAIRDVRVVQQHFWVAPGAIAEAGRVLLGLDPISPTL